jgi:hypothetical protein
VPTARITPNPWPGDLATPRSGQQAALGADVIDLMDGHRALVLPGQKRAGVFRALASWIWA